ncbi:MAG: hypothetical protein KDE51_03745 [Anaerolineales bacterium]|nr:hypothetical protein [Anaerolineales bacterium]
MSNLQTILDALIVDVPPNTSAEHAEDHFRKRQHHLMMLVDQRLADEPASQDMIKKYLEDSSVWESNLAETLTAADLHNDAEVVEAAEAVLASIELYQPEQPDVGLPSSIPGVLEDTE